MSGPLLGVLRPLQLLYLLPFVVVAGAFPLYVLTRTDWASESLPGGLVRVLFGAFVLSLGSAWWLKATDGDAPPLFALAFPFLQLGLFRAFQESFRALFGRPWAARGSDHYRTWDGVFYGLFLMTSLIGPMAASFPYFDQAHDGPPPPVEVSSPAFDE